MKLRNLFFITLFFFQYKAMAQIQVSDASVLPYTPENLITNYFLGEGVTVTSVTYEGSNEAIGYFDKGKTATGIQRGIVMTTGRAVNNPTNNLIKGIANNGSVQASSDNFVGGFDNDIKTIAAGKNIFNLAKYTIKFIPTSDTLRFKYVFASEEYPEFGCSNFNDIFGFFISGPGINGPYENKGINIALVPGTNLPVSINNIHPQSDATNPPCPAKNVQYYISNNDSNKQPVYDGLTNVFTAEAIVTPCQEYTIKLIITDLGDAGFDSGVFLEAKSFGTGTLKVVPQSLSLDGTVVEGCTDGKLTFSLRKKVDEDYPIDLKIIGNAQNGIDYEAIPTDLYITAGDSTLSIPIIAKEDNLTETPEVIGFDVRIDICHRDTFYMYIKDNKLVKPEIGKDTTICRGDIFVKDATLPVPLPIPPYFENKDTFFINTVTNSIKNPPTTSPITVFGVQPTQLADGMIESVCINVKHKWIDEIDAYLIAPNGQFIELTTDNGGSGGNGAGQDFYDKTCFKPKSTKPIASGTSPFLGDYQAEGEWSDLWGVKDNPVNGVWKLQIIDDFAGLEGQLLDWNITFKPFYQINYNWTPKKGLSCSNCPKPTFFPDSTTTYIVEVFDNYGCPVSDTITVVVEDSLKAPKVLCGIVTHNSVQFAWNVVPFANGYEVSVNGGAWIAPTNAFSHKVTGLGLLENVTIQVRAKGTCGGKIGVQSCQTLNCTSATPQIDNLSQISCFGEKDGTIKLSATGGLVPYSFKLGSETNNNGFFNKLSAGSYTVSVVEAAGCVSLVKFDVVEPEKLKFSYGADSVTCFGGADAAAIVLIKGGTQPLKYQWNNGITDSIAYNLDAKNYLVKITDKNNCEITDTVKVFQPKEIKLVADVEDVACYGSPSGSARITPNGGEAPYYYKWDTNIGLQVAPKAVKLVPGLHYVTVTDNKGCVAKTSVKITSPDEINLTLSKTNIACFGQKNGTAKVQVKGGISPYTFLWNDTSKSKDSLVKNLALGFYTVSVTDKNGCVVKDSVQINQPDSLSLLLINQNIFCFGEKNGQTEVQVKGGTTPYTYSWSNLVNGVPKIENLAAGDYNVTISDFKNCIKIAKTTITTPDSLKIDFVTKATDCNGAATGEIKTTVTGGSAPYFYSWTGQGGFTSSDADISNLKSGTYTLELKDLNDCIKIKTVKITQPNPVLFTPVLTDVKCKGKKTGKIELLISGGSLPYQYQWDSGQNTPNIGNLSVGTYTLTLTDNLACTYIETYEIKEPTQTLTTTMNVSDTLCFGQKGMAKVTVNGGTLPYTYAWANGETKDEITNVFAGKYPIIVSDANDCSIKDTAFVYELGKVTLKLTQTAASCFEYKDGTAKVDEILYGAINTNLSSFNYVWNNATSNIVADKLTGGQTYTVVATDKRGCTGTTNIKIGNPDAIKVTPIKTILPLCFGQNNGEITVKAEGGTAPFSFVWDNIQTGDKATNLKAGTYKVTVSDDKGCANTAEIKMNEPKKLSAAYKLKGLDCPQTPTGAIEMFASGGTLPYTYKWSNNANTNLISSLLSDTYQLTITDANACKLDTSIFVPQPTPLDLSIDKKDVTCSNSKDGSFKAIVKGGTPPFLFSFNNQNFSGQNNFVGLKPNVYSIIIKDKNNCLFEEQIEINEPSPINIDMGKDSTIFYGDSVQLAPIITDTVGKITLNWTPFNPLLMSCDTCKNPIVYPKTSTLYTLQVIDSQGCISKKSIDIFIKVRDEAFVPTAFTANNDGLNDLLLVHGEKGTKVLTFSIFDRWGERIYHHENSLVNDEKIGWDGTFRGNMMPSGTYAWMLFVELINGERRTFSGSTNLIR